MVSIAAGSANLHPVPEGVSDDQAALVEALATALAVTDQLHIRPTEHVVVLGDGKLGLLIAQVLALTGCRLAGRRPARGKIGVARFARH